MVGARHRLICLATAAAMLLPGCRAPNLGGFPEVSSQAAIEVPAEIDLDEPIDEEFDPYMVAATVEPQVVDDSAEPVYWDLSLEHAVQMAVDNSKVLRELGGLVVRAPTTIRTTQDPAITQTDPRFGVEAALSQFDTIFDYNALFEKNHRALNNVFLGGGTRVLHQDAYVFQSQLSKRAATGAEFTIRNNTDYDSNNAPGNKFYSSWNTNIETAVRQPLLQGGGVDFNRIYGPGGIPGLPSGV
ncbi:MAG: TolC family protein, partial [Planctomycetaceae bacterium]